MQIHYTFTADIKSKNKGTTYFQWIQEEDYLMHAHLVGWKAVEISSVRTIWNGLLVYISLRNRPSSHTMNNAFLCFSQWENDNVIWLAVFFDLKNRERQCGYKNCGSNFKNNNNHNQVLDFKEAKSHTTVHLLFLHFPWHSSLFAAMKAKENTKRCLTKILLCISHFSEQQQFQSTIF